MTASGLLSLLVVPPVNLALLAALALLAGRRRLAGLSLSLLLLLAVPLVGRGLMAGLEPPSATSGQSPAQAPAQAIVVLGAEVVRQDDGRTVPGPLSLGRLRHAAGLARRTGLPLLVSGGVTEPGAAPVAAAMADSLREDFATPARWVEDRSPDTFGNARESAAMLASAGITRVLVVTDAWHMRRALLAFRAAGLDATPAPVPPPAPAGLGWADFVPRASAWQRSFYALHEWIGLAWYTLRASLPA